MPRIVKTAAVILLVFASALLLCTCGRVEAVDIISGGLTEYTVVRAKGGTDLEKALAVDLRNRLEEITGAPIKLVNDTSDEGTFEIIVGSANRPAAKDISLAPNEYTVTFKDGKIVILGGDDKSLKEAFDYFLSEFLNCKYDDGEYNKMDKISIPKNLDHKGSYTTREEFLNETRLVEYPALDEREIPRDYDYTVRVIQGDKAIELPVYNPVFGSDYFNSSMNGDWHRRYCEFAFSGDPVTVEITVNMDFSSYSVMPSSKQIPSSYNKNVITYTLDKPQTTVFKVNEDRDTMLAIFAEEPLFEDDIPDKNDPKVIYFEAGVHEVENGVLRPGAGMTVFLEPGALVKARVKIGSDSKLLGRGAFLEPSKTRMPVDEQRYMLRMDGENITVDGIKLLDSHDYNIVTTSVGNLEIKNVKVISNQISTDGFSIFGKGRDVLIHDCFFHISDNVFVMGTNNTTYKNFVVTDCILASDYATFFPQQDFGADSTLVFKNLDVLRSGSFYKQTHNPEKTERTVGNIIIENVYAVDVDTKSAFIWIKNFDKGVKNIHFKNVSAPAPKDVGLDIAPTTEDLTVTFDNVWLGDKLFTADTEIKNTMDKSLRNKFVFTDTSDPDAVFVGKKNVVKLDTPYVAQKVKINDYTVGCKVLPFTENGVTYVSAYEIISELWFEDVSLNGNTGTLTFRDAEKTYEACADGTNIFKDGRLMVPISFFEETLGIKAENDGETVTLFAKRIGENLLNNPGIEEGLSMDWITRNFSKLYLSEEAHSGKYSILVGMKGASNENGIYQDISRIVRKYGKGTYRATAYVKKASDECDSTKISIGITGGFNLNFAPYKSDIALTDEWQKVECVYIVANPDELSKLDLIVGGADGSVKDYVVDDISFVKLN